MRRCGEVVTTVELELDESMLEVHESIGVGSTAEVFKGSIKGYNVAVKQIIVPPRMMTARALESLRRELEVMRTVSHPRLVNLFGVVLTTPPFRLIMELCDGGTVFELLYNAGVELAPEQTFKMSDDVCVAMDYLHSFTPQILHRDLKSLNLLMEEPVVSSYDIPMIKVADFGLSRMLEPGKCMTKQAGTANWMAPEVFTSNAYGCAADVYSYGIIIYEILCREIPFEGVHKERLGLFVVIGGRPDLKRIPADAPKLLFDLMVRCWAPEASHRPSFREIFAVLRGATHPNPSKSPGQDILNSDASIETTDIFCAGPDCGE
mmetsp:Transcript_97205/g.274787  ORF Transcript_97205/g.274787 Transcript_97205/m.274787 type:complete len:320 (-) Transcript_97205:135-1094(-)